MGALVQKKPEGLAWTYSQDWLNSPHAHAIFSQPAIKSEYLLEDQETVVELSTSHESFDQVTLKCLPGGISE